MAGRMASINEIVNMIKQGPYRDGIAITIHAPKATDFWFPHREQGDPMRTVNELTFILGCGGILTFPDGRRAILTNVRNEGIK